MNDELTRHIHDDIMRVEDKVDKLLEGIVLILATVHPEMEIVAVPRD